MIDTARKYSTARLAINRRITVGGGILAMIVLAEAVMGQMRHFI